MLKSNAESVRTGTTDSQTNTENTQKNTADIQVNTPPKKKRKPLRVTLCSIAVLLTALVFFTLVSPIPVSFIIRAAFTKKIAVAPDNYEEISSQVEVFKNLRYPSNYKDNTADIYLPKNSGMPLPIVLWVHGGAFVGGDKEDIAVYATALAAQGLAVVCINYRRAPEAKYPIPVVQTNEAYLWLKDIAGSYAFDLERFVIAGDSAGAHIAAQFAAIQSNADYAAEMKIEQSVPLHTLKAALLFCGPFDVAKIDESNNFVMNFLLGKAAQAYFGSKDWGTHFAHQATIANHITGSFPPVFITDGNDLSFEEHGSELADALRAMGVFAETYFVSPGAEKTPHEYQFVMNTPAGQESFERVTEFIKQRVK